MSLNQQILYSQKHRSSKVSIYHLVPSFEIPADIFEVLKVFEEPLGESNTERRVKYRPVFQKNAPNDIYCQIPNFLTRG